MKKAALSKAAFLMVAPPGLEPGKTVPKTGVLPLHHGAIAHRPGKDRQGEVTLSGISTSSYMVEKAIGIAESVSGVSGVQNKLTVAE